MLKNSDILTGKHKLKKLFVKRGECCHPTALFFFYSGVNNIKK